MSVYPEPCPGCGRTPRIVNMRGRIRVNCFDREDCNLSSRSFDTETEAIAHWNSWSAAILAPRSPQTQEAV